jgi:hypothetical protein
MEMYPAVKPKKAYGAAWVQTFPALYHAILSAAPTPPAALSATQPPDTALVKALERLGSMEAFVTSRSINAEHDAELLARIEFAREALRLHATPTPTDQVPPGKLSPRHFSNLDALQSRADETLKQEEWAVIDPVSLPADTLGKIREALTAIKQECSPEGTSAERDAYAFATAALALLPSTDGEGT